MQPSNQQPSSPLPVREHAPVSILFVEDDQKLGRLIQEFLQQQGLSVSIEVSGAAAAERIISDHPDLVILDIMLPGKDGLTVCREVRPHFAGPILILTARGDETDELAGLGFGADDYMTKPVRPQLLLARIKTLLRRTHNYDIDTRIRTVGRLTIDAGRRTLMIEGKQRELTTSEFDLLWLLVSRAGEVVTRDQISAVLRGFQWDGKARSLDLAVSRLRRKIGDNTRTPEMIRSIRGIGYLWMAE